jgi:uncharacterized protein (TIRG00374 family)
LSRRSQAVAGFALAAFFAWLFLRQADLQQVLQALRDASLPLVLVTLVINLFTSVLRSWRWRYLLAPIAPVAFRPLLECTLMGWTVSVLLPGRLGEIARPVLLSRRTEVKASAAIGSVVLERIFDALTVLVLLAAYLAFLPAPAAVSEEGRVVLDAMRGSGMLGLAGLLGLGAITVMAMRNRRFMSAVDRLIERWLPARLGLLARSFIHGMSGLRSLRLLAMISFSSLLLWMTIVSTYVVLFHALGVDLPWYAAIPVLALMVVGVMIPTPGGVGSFHKAAQLGLVGLWGVNNDLAVAYAIVSHAVAFLPLAVIGLVLLLREGMTLGTLQGLGGAEPGSPPGRV